MGCASSQDATATGDPIDESPHESIARAASIKISRQLQSDFGDKYTLGEHLGEGNSATVFKARNKKTGQEYAVKCIGKVDAEGNLLDKDSEESLEKEVEILQGVRNHPYILHLEEYMQDGIYHYLVTELIEGGELFDRIISKQFYSEAEARDLVKTLLEAVQFLHDKNIAHRDLKPENLLLKSGDDDSSIKIADFGFADITYNDDDLVLPCGTPNYAAPEILQGQNYGRQVDVWSIGVITYILLCGYPPFHDDVQVEWVGRLVD
jgi:calcium/calmodulin-dependent protein kinase I